MIHIVLGTKGQLIKMSPIIKFLDKKKIVYNYIDTDQHSKITNKLRGQLKIKEPDYSFIRHGKNIDTTAGGLFWILKILLKSIFHHKKIFKNDKKGLCLVHGDTVSTLLGAIMGIISRQKIVHIEAGFRTSKLFKPFPEEMIRRMVDRLSFINFPLSYDAEVTLKKEKNKGLIFNPGENTLIDIVKIATNNATKINLPKKYILVSIHRYETIYSKKRMTFIANLLNKLASKNKIIWGLHQPTKNALIKFNLYSNLKNNKNIKLLGLFDYFDFISAIKESDFLITDGGGPQDESKYLSIPCLLMRTETEKLGYKNVHQCDFKIDKIRKFLKNINKFRIKYKNNNLSPSKKIVEFLLNNSIVKNNKT